MPACHVQWGDCGSTVVGFCWLWRDFLAELVSRNSSVPRVFLRLERVGFREMLSIMGVLLYHPQNLCGRSS